MLLFNSACKMKRKLQFDLPNPPVTSEDVTIVLERYNRPDEPAMLEKHHLPEIKPVICNLVEADNGYLWLKKGEFMVDHSGKSPITYMVIDEKGEYIGDQELPFSLSKIKDGFAYGFMTNEDDLRIFKRYKLTQLRK